MAGPNSLRAPEEVHLDRFGRTGQSCHESSDVLLLTPVAEHAAHCAACSPDPEAALLLAEEHLGRNSSCPNDVARAFSSKRSTQNPRGSKGAYRLISLHRLGLGSTDRSPFRDPHRDVLAAYSTGHFEVANGNYTEANPIPKPRDLQRAARSSGAAHVERCFQGRVSI
jgi:hypothetical protein